MSQLREFVDTLDGDEKAAFLGSLPFLWTLVSMADGKRTVKEWISIMKNTFATRNLDEEFMQVFALSKEEILKHAKDLEKKSVLHPGSGVMDEEFRKIKEIMNKMPRDLGNRYRGFVLESCFRVAEASAGFMGFGERINDHEKGMLRKIIDELELEVQDAEIRKILEI